jgi:hypothetical protein
MSNRYATQGRLLIDALKRKPHTYMQMLAHGVSVSPWKRVAESLRDDERVEKGRNAKGLTTWRVVRVAR